MCFQLVELILRIRDRVLNTSKMKPILNGLYWVQTHSKNLRNLECKIELAEVPINRLSSQARENLKFVCEVLKMVEVSVIIDSYYTINKDARKERLNTISYFFKHPEAFYFEETSKETFLKTLDVDNPRYEIVKNMVVFGKEMSLNSEFANSHPKIYTVLTNDNMQWLKIILWTIGLVLNSVILVTYKLKEVPVDLEISAVIELVETEGEKIRKLGGDGWETWINILSYIFAFFNLVLFLLWALFKWRIMYKINREKYFVKHQFVGKDDLSVKKILDLIFVESFWNSSYVPSFALHTIFALLGTLIDPFFHTLHLLLWFNISEAAKYILDASTKRINTLS